VQFTGKLEITSVAKLSVTTKMLSSPRLKVILLWWVHSAFSRRGLAARCENAARPRRL